MRRIAALAGAYTIKYPCDNECEGIVEETFTSRAELERHESSHGKHICAECSKREKEESERKFLRLKKASEKRIAELQAMSWKEFIDTPEWVTRRNHALEATGFGCEVCGASNVSLNVCLHKDITEFPFPSERYFVFRANSGTHFYVLCHDCIKRCEDLLHPEWKERIKAEFVGRIEHERMRG